MTLVHGYDGWDADVTATLCKLPLTWDRQGASNLAIQIPSVLGGWDDDADITCRACQQVMGELAMEINWDVMEKRTER